VEGPGVTDRGGGWRWCLVICNDGGGGKEMVRSSGGRSFQRREDIRPVWCLPLLGTIPFT